MERARCPPRALGQGWTWEKGQEVGIPTARTIDAAPAGDVQGGQGPPRVWSMRRVTRVLGRQLGGPQEPLRAFRWHNITCLGAGPGLRGPTDSACCWQWPQEPPEARWFAVVGNVWSWSLGREQSSCDTCPPRPAFPSPLSTSPPLGTHNTISYFPRTRVYRAPTVCLALGTSFRTKHELPPEGDPLPAAPGPRL